MQKKLNGTRPSLMRMTLPVFIEYAMAMFVGNIDQIMISNYSEDSVAAIGNANQVLNLLVLTFTIISLSTTILVSQYIGAGRRDEVGVIYTLAVVVNTVVGAVMSAALVLLAHPIAVFMGVDPVLYEEFELYLSIVGGGIFLQAVFSTFTAVFKSNAFMKESTFLSVLINIVNIIFNFLLIYGIGFFPEMGIAGVAIATVLGRIVGVVAIILLYRKKIGVSLSLKQLRPFPVSVFRKMLVIGVPAGGESVSYNLTQLVIMMMINSFGLTDVKTKMFVSMLATITWMFASAVSQASQILVGYDVGAGNYDSAQKQTISTLRLALAASAGVAVLMMLLSRPLLSLLTDNEAIFELGKKILALDIILEIGRAANMTYVRALQAAGDTKFPVVLGICSTWVISVLLSFVFGVICGLGLVGVWIAMAADECVRAVIFVFRWRGGKWRSMSFVSSKAQTE